jgi:methylphosphotriester-DNA--protein-cysteine methyltransferase
MSDWKPVIVGDIVTTKGHAGAGQPVVTGEIAKIEGGTVFIEIEPGVVRRRSISNVRLVPDAERCPYCEHRACKPGTPEEAEAARIAAEARKPYADVLRNVQALVDRWQGQAQQLQRQAMRADISDETATRKSERAAGLRTAATELRRELGL